MDSRTNLSDRPSPSRRRLETVAQVLAALVIIVPPLVVSGSLLHPFVAPKVYVFRGLVLALVAVSVAVALFWRERLLRFASPISIAVILYLASWTVSSANGVDWGRSFWDSGDRMLGLFTLLHIGAFYFILASLFRRNGSSRGFLRIFLVVATIVLAIAVLQKLDPELLYNRGSRRVSSTLGNPEYLGAFGIFTTFIGFLLVRTDPIRWIRWAAGIVAGLGITGVFLSETRSSLVGMGVGVLVLLASYALSLPRGAPARRSAGIAFLVLLVLGVGFVAIRDAPALTNIPGLRRFAGISRDSRTWRLRGTVWKMAIEAGASKPLLGWGPNNFYYAADRVYDPSLLRLGLEKTWVDDAHDVILESLAARGSLGVATTIALVLVPIVSLWAARRRRQVNRSVACAFTALLVAHFVHGLFVFDDLTAWILFVLVLASIDGDSTRRRTGFEEGSAQAGGPSARWPGRMRNATTVAACGAASFVLALAFLAWFTNVREAWANHLAFRAIERVHAGDSMQAVELFERSAALESRHQGVARALFCGAVLERVNLVLENGRKDDLRPLIRLAYEELGKEQLAHPLDVRPSLWRGELARVLSTAFGDHEASRASIVEIDRARGLAPRRQALLFVLSVLELQLGMLEDGIARLEEAVALDPLASESCWRLALIYRALGDAEKSREVIESARARGVHFRPADLKNVEG